MSLRDEILTPIEGDNPSGEYLRYSPDDNIYDDIREARRQDAPDAEKYLGEGAAKRADYRRVIELAGDALTARTKDLELAAWLTEALIWERGAAGLREGLEVILGILENFWETVYPEIENGDAEFRSAPLHWLGSYLEPSRDSSPRLGCLNIPFTEDNLPWIELRAARQLAYEKDCGGDKNKRKAREEAIASGIPPPEEADQRIVASRRAFYESLNGELVAARELIAKLDAFCTEKFEPDILPSFNPLRDDLDEIQREVDKILPIKRAQEPDPPPAASTEEAESKLADENPPEAAIGETLDLQLESGAPTNQAAAINQLVKTALHLQRTAPTNPVSYLVLRAIRWGELRASGSMLDPLMLEAPSTEYRTELRRNAAAGNWQKVLETAEKAMAGTCGRGWLDLQRYVIRACEELGHQSVAHAIRSELRALLRDYPHLPDATLLDDTGAANPETLAWLRDSVLADSDESGAKAG